VYISKHRENPRAASPLIGSMNKNKSKVIRTGKQYLAAIQANRERVAREYKAETAKYNAKPAKHKIVINEDGSKSVVKLDLRDPAILEKFCNRHA
jgi:hypothetical protein